MRYLAIAAALLGFFGVALGAFGAHGLQSLVSPARLATWQTAVSYQMYHVAVLLIIAGWDAKDGRKLLAWAGGCLLAGVLVFSGSLYLLVLLDMPRLGMVTPLGGTLLLVGWLLLLLAIVKHQRRVE